MCVHIYIYISLGSNRRDPNHFSKKNKVPVSWSPGPDLCAILHTFAENFWEPKKVCCDGRPPFGVDCGAPLHQNADFLHHSTHEHTCPYVVPRMFSHEHCAGSVANRTWQCLRAHNLG